MRVFNYILTFICLILLSVTDAKGQDLAFSGQDSASTTTSNIKGPLEFKGHVKELSKKLKGAIITLYHSPDGSHDDLEEIFRTVSPGNGEFSFKLEVNKMFVMSVEKGGYTTKMVDFDTDVSMARPQYTKVPLFEFEVDMVKDLDGLAFKGSVASVFYQIKQNKFDYELDYSKEEMENEERQLRIEEEKRRLAELAAQKKFEIQEAAKLLLDMENASAQQIIEASIKVGDGDKQKTIDGFMKVFSEVDTLREKKAEAMYAQLLEQRQTDAATAKALDYQAIFDAATTLENQVTKTIEEERNKKVEVLRTEKEEAKRKMDEALAIQQKALELEMKEKLEATSKQHEIQKAKEEKERRDKVYYAIFDSNGDRETAIKNLMGTYPKGDAYREQKAEAIYTEYEKAKLTEASLSKMDFNKLFKAADNAEQQAIKEDIDKDNSKQNARLDAFMKKVEDRKQQEQADVIGKIEEGLKNAASDHASQIAVFMNALPKNETYKEEKAKAMYEEYLKQKKQSAQIEEQLKNAPADRTSQLQVFKDAISENDPDRDAKAQRMFGEYVKNKQIQGGTGTVSVDFQSLFQAAGEAEASSKTAAKQELVKQKRQAQEALEARRDAIRQEKQKLAAKAAEDAKRIHAEAKTAARTQQQQSLSSAIQKGGGDRDQTVRAIMNILPKSDDKDFDRDRAEAVYDEYLKENQRVKQSGSTTAKVDYGQIFKAADNAELAKLQRQYEAKQAIEQKKLDEYTTDRLTHATEVAKANQKLAEKKIDQAEIAYEDTRHKIEVQRQERLADQQKQQEQQAKEIAMEQAKREAEEMALANGELDRVRREQQAKIDQENRKAEQAAAELEAEREKLENAAKAEADRQLAQAEKERKAAENAAQKAEQNRIAAEQKRLDAEAKAAKNAALAAAKAEQDSIRQEQKRLADEEKAKQIAVAAAQKAAELARKEEQRKQEELAKLQAERIEQEKLTQFQKLVAVGDAAVSGKKYQKGWDSYKDALTLYPDDKDVNQKLKDTDVELQKIRQAEADQLALNEKYDALMKEGEMAQAADDFQKAISKFQSASDLKPKAQLPKQNIRNINRIMADLAKAEKAKQAKERQYIVYMQDGSIALNSNDLDLAKNKYQKASSLKPEESEPKDKLKEIADLEQQMADAAKDDLAKKEEAKRKFEEQQKIERQRQEAEAERLRNEQEARGIAMDKVDSTKQEQQQSLAEQDQVRIDEYNKLKEAVKQMDLEEEEQRMAFLSELAKIYPQGITKETVEGKNFVVTRHVINDNNVVTIYERKTWDWGGVFYFKNSDIAITQAIYELEIGKYGN